MPWWLFLGGASPGSRRFQLVSRSGDEVAGAPPPQGVKTFHSKRRMARGVALRLLFGRTVSIGAARRFFLAIETFGLTRHPPERYGVGVVSTGSAVRGLTVERIPQESAVELGERLRLLATDLGLSKCVVEEVESIDPPR